MIRRWLILAGFILLGCTGMAEAACTGSSPTRTALNNTFAEVDNCVSVAARGDTINVPAGGGTATWTGSTLTLTKGVKLLGPGRDNLVIAVGNAQLFTSAIDFAPDATAIANEETIKVDGFTFDGLNTAGVFFKVHGTDAGGVKPFKNLIITNNRLKNSQNTTSGSNANIYQNGQVRGVIANNIFDRTQVLMRCLGNDVYSDWTSGNYPITVGTLDSLYFEDNLYTATTAFNGNANAAGWIECGQSGRIVMRYNTWDYTNITNQDETWDYHGFQGGETGTMVVEAFANTLIGRGASAYRWSFQRGGLALFFNNTNTGTSGDDLVLGNWDTNGCTSQNGVTGSQINNSYYWNNTSNGGQKDTSNISGGGYNGVCPPVANVDIWNQASASINAAPCTTAACTAGIGRATTAPTGICTMGTAMWVASTATPTTSTSVNQAGKIYKCTNTNVWTLYYQPFTYPHPLRALNPLSLGVSGGMRASGGARVQ